LQKLKWKNRLLSILKPRIDLSKNPKGIYYLQSYTKFFTPSWIFQRKAQKLLSYYNALEADEQKAIMERVNYYNQLNSSFTMEHPTTIKNFLKSERHKTYFFDLMEHLRLFDKDLHFNYLFGDITHIPDEPTLLKSRPIAGDNHNAILMKLNRVRHFTFVNDTTPFEAKENRLVWRGGVHVPHRIAFMEKFFEHPMCDVGQTNKDKIIKWIKNRMSIKEQLKYKFILSIEGNDVASNLKWAMSSNSLVMMTNPKFETWFMEGTLIPNHHYVLLEEDYSNLEEKMHYYSEHIDEAKAIIANANAYVEQFKNTHQEDLISYLVLQKYFEQSKQLDSTK